jgi:hypothetical protein
MLLAAVLALFSTGLVTVRAQAPPREQFHLFLLVGQSNMAGRGEVEAQDRQPHPRVLMLTKDQRWVPAADPMHFDKPIAGVGLGKTFGMLVADANPGITVGLIPAAVGGSPIDAWEPGAYYEPTGSHPWDDAIVRARVALRSGVLKGILWHQGESDSTAALASGYAAKLHRLIGRFRSELNAPDVPFIVGQLGEFKDAPWDDARRTVDRAHRDLPASILRTGVASARGLTDKGDKIHFDSASYREFGRRYFEEFQRVTSAR